MAHFLESFFHKRKFRHYLAWPFVILLAIFARSSDLGFTLGIPIIIVGEMVRLWSSGYLFKGRQLATDGPYAFVRHPLYVGNFLIGFGFCIIIFHPIVFVVFLAGFFWTYRVTIGVEEEKLMARFAPSFKPYREQVHPFLPRLMPYPYRSRDPFHFDRVLEHGEHITILAISVLIIVLYLRQEIYQFGRYPSELGPSWIFFGINFLILSFFQLQRRAEKKQLVSSN